MWVVLWSERGTIIVIMVHLWCWYFGMHPSTELKFAPKSIKIYLRTYQNSPPKVSKFTSKSIKLTSKIIKIILQNENSPPNMKIHPQDIKQNIWKRPPPLSLDRFQGNRLPFTLWAVAWPVTIGRRRWRRRWWAPFTPATIMPSHPTCKSGWSWKPIMPNRRAPPTSDSNTKYPR